MKNLRSAMKDSNAQLVQIYLESSWDIVTAVYNDLANIENVSNAIDNGTLDDFLSETDIDTLTKLNAILTDATLGRFSTQAEAEAGLDNSTTMTPLRVSQAIAVLAAGIQNDYAHDGPPTVNDDSNAGYSAGSVIIDITADPDESYRCSDPSVGAAVWVKTTLTTDELATVALTGSSDDLVEGVTQLLMTAGERSKLTGIEPSAKDDQTDAEIETAYNNQVSQVSSLEKTEGTATGIRRFSPVDIAEMALAHGPSGGTNSALNKVIAGTTYTILEADNGYNLIFTNAADIAVTLPDTLTTHFQCSIIQAAAGIPTVTPNTDTVNGAGTGVAPADQWKAMYLTQYADTEWLAVL